MSLAGDSPPPAVAADGGARYRVSIVGPSEVGKTQLMQRFHYGIFSAERAPTLGVEFCTWRVPNRRMELAVWDAGGQPRFKSISQSHLQSAQCIVFVFDMNRRDSFAALSRYARDVSSLTADARVRLLVGTKIDKGQCDVRDVDVERFRHDHAIDAFYPCSAATGAGISLVFSGIVHHIERKFGVHPSLLQDAAGPPPPAVQLAAPRTPAAAEKAKACSALATMMRLATCGCVGVK